MNARKVRSRAGRKPLTLGQHGSIAVKRLSTGSYRASCRFRLASGLTVPVSRQARTKSAAQANLLDYLKTLSVNPGLVHLDTTLPELAEFWVDEIIQGTKFSAQTKAAYEHAAREYVAARLPLVRVGEVTVPVVNGLLTELAGTPANAKRARVVLGHMLDMAVNHGAIPQSPVPNSRSVEQADTHARALSADLLDLIHEAVTTWEAAWTSGPRRNGNLMFDVLDLLLATAARIGEVLALRWCDIDLDSDHPSVTICGTLVAPAGQGLYRQPKPKTKAGFRQVFLPAYATEMLRRRRDEQKPNTLDAVFASRADTWVSPGNFTTRLQQAFVKYPELKGVTPKVFRSTVATELKNRAEGGVDTAKSQLGHASSRTTEKHYVVRAVAAPDVSDLLEEIGGIRGRTSKNK